MIKNIGSNWFLMALTAITTYVLMPFNLNSLGNENYGIWLIISSITAYLFLLHLGVPMASVRELTQAIALKDDERINRIVTSCGLLYLVFGVVVMLLGVPLYFFFVYTYEIPLPVRGEARAAFVISLMQTGLAFIATMPYAILSAYESFVAKNVLMAIVLIVRTIVNIVLVLMYPSFITLGILMLIATVFEMVLAWGYIFRTYPVIRPRLSLFSMETVRGIFGFSIWVFLMALGSQLAFQTSPLIIGHYMTSADVPSVAVPNSLMLILMQFVGGIASVIMPVATNMQTTGDFATLRHVYFKWTKISLALSVCAGLFLVIFGPSFLKFWIGPSYTPESGAVLQILAASYMVFLPVRGVAVPVLMGLGHAKWPTIATLTAGVMNLGMSIALVGPYGLEGVAWAMAIPNVLLSVVLAILACRALKITPARYLATIFPLAIIATGAAFVTLALWSEIWRPHGMFGLAVAGVLTMGVCVVLWTELVLRDDPHVKAPRLSLLLRG
ncbi:MAG TPA: polysaccharide biosynthesis C-terminal domain-containing protein [Hyphomicrobiaceae bacterium]|nr:polysaccharide biosynthesis C-terminal domain-containing protein [Hyphomicrobiaceae bacterium]